MDDAATAGAQPSHAEQNHHILFSLLIGTSLPQSASSPGLCVFGSPGALSSSGWIARAVSVLAFSELTTGRPI